MKNIKFNDLQRIIIVLLNDSNKTGYDISKILKEETSAWDSSHQQIYRELKKLLKHSLVSVTEQYQAGKPDRRTYSLTDLGRIKLKDIQTDNQLDKIAYHDHSTVMLKALNSKYFIASIDNLIAAIEINSERLFEIESEIEYALIYRKISMMKAQLEYSKAALLTITTVIKSKNAA